MPKENKPPKSLALTGLTISATGPKKVIIIPTYAHDLVSSFEGQPLLVTITRLEST